MDPKQTAMRNKQRERQQRGDDFQAEIRRSWRGVPNVWRMRIADGAGATRPGDEIVITPEVNILAEMKRTESPTFLVLWYTTTFCLKESNHSFPMTIYI